MKYLHSGAVQWTLQRVSAVFLWLYLAAIFFYLPPFHAPLSVFDWKAHLTAPWMQILGVAAFLSYTVHVLIGLWIVATDYLPNLKIRHGVLGVCTVATLASVVVALWCVVTIS